MSLPAPSALGPADYLALEREGEQRHELVEGERVALAGASLNHVRIVGNVFASLRRQLETGDCEAFGGDLKVHVPATGLFAYPDLSVVCGPIETYDRLRDVVLNPTLLVEVLSPSTEAFDRGAKFAQYRALPSLQGYLLISQDRITVEHYGRGEDSWRLRTADRLRQTLALPEIGASLSLAAVYQRIF